MGKYSGTKGNKEPDDCVTCDPGYVLLFRYYALPESYNVNYHKNGIAVLHVFARIHGRFCFSLTYGFAYGRHRTKHELTINI